MIKRNTPVLPERQITPFPFRVTEIRGARAAEGGGTLVRVEGEATVYGYRYEVYGGPAHMGWFEEVSRGAADETLAADPDVVFLLNHTGLPVARTKSGTLQLKGTKTGLFVASDLDTRDTDVSNLLVKMERGDVDEMSFAFRVTRQRWTNHEDYPDDEMAVRFIEAFNIHRGDVSAVTFGASDATSIKTVETDIARSLQFASAAELEEYQALIAERLAVSNAPGGTPGQGSGGMPAHLVQMLRIPANPLLEDYP